MVVETHGYGGTRARLLVVGDANLAEGRLRPVVLQTLIQGSPIFCESASPTLMGDLDPLLVVFECCRGTDLKFDDDFSYLLALLKEFRAETL